MWSAKEYDATSIVEDVPKMLFWSLSCHRQSLYLVLGRCRATTGRTTYILTYEASQTVPDEYDRAAVLLHLVSFPKQSGLLMLTVSSFSLYVAILVNKFIEWSPILFVDTTPRQSATYATYPNVRTRALGTFDGSKD